MFTSSNTGKTYTCVFIHANNSLCTDNIKYFFLFNYTLIFSLIFFTALDYKELTNFSVFSYHSISLSSILAHCQSHDHC